MISNFNNDTAGRRQTETHWNICQKKRDMKVSDCPIQCSKNKGNASKTHPLPFISLSVWEGKDKAKGNNKAYAMDLIHIKPLEAR